MTMFAGLAYQFDKQEQEIIKIDSFFTNYLVYQGNKNKMKRIKKE